MNVVTAIALCFIPLVALLACMAIAVKEFSWTKGLVATLLGLLALVPIELVLILLGNVPVFQEKSVGALLLRTMILNGLLEESIEMLMLIFTRSKNKTQGLHCICNAGRIFAGQF